MADEQLPKRGVAYFDGEGNQVSGMPDPLIVFYWARLDEIERQADGADPATFTAPFRRTLADVAAKKAILDDYERRCRDITNPAREMECALIRGVIRQLATVYAGHPDYDESWRP